MAACRVGLVGAGGVAQRHARVLSGFDDVRIIGVTDVLEQAADRLAATCDARAYPDVAALLNADLDAVYLCVPPFAHGPAEEAVLTAGLPLFVEKPVAIDLATAERVERLVRHSRVVTAVGHHWRYLTVVERAAGLLVGRPVRLITGSWLDKVPPVAWWSRRDRSGGPVVEQAAHVLDLVRHLAGEVHEVYATANHTPPQVTGADIDCATAATLWFNSGAVGTLATTNTLTWKQFAGVELYADDLAISLSEEALIVRDGAAEQRLHADPDAARTAVDRAFVDAVRGIEDDVRVPYAEALRTHRLALAITESAATARAVRVTGTEVPHA